MKFILFTSLLLMVAAMAQEMKRSIPYVENGHERHVLDVYSPANAKNLPVVFWIHGGGWQSGDKANVQEKPAWFTKKGFVFVSINHRLLPEVEMDVLVRDVAKAFGWMHKHIAEYGGDPQRVLVGGHSSGAQLATLICTDDRYLKAEGVSFKDLIGCVPVDGDTYDIPAIIETAETRLRVHGMPMPKYGHRLKFGNDPAKHIDFSAVTHVAKGKNIPPFLIIHVADHPDNSIQAKRFEAALKPAEIPVTIFGGKETNHSKINALIGTEGDATTQALEEFVRKVKGKSR
ncbi:MAG: alpha/beta hydrolase [Verrucomicrobia bacterium]|nr:alpha/beta hydrolase [Verrucomicrobiota bacterium]